MTNLDTKQHWENVYRTKSPLEVSWRQERPGLSLKLIDQCRLRKSDPIIDVGGGASTLVDCLLQRGFEDVAVLDVSAAAIEHAQQRLGETTSRRVQWIERDVRSFAPARQFSLWHDRAAFHFLTESADRALYVQSLKRAVRPGGHVIIAAFAPDGPNKCSGLPVAQHNAESLKIELGDDFVLRAAEDEVHITPWSSAQKFAYALFERSSG